MRHGEGLRLHDFAILDAGMVSRRLSAKYQWPDVLRTWKVAGGAVV